MGKNYDLKRGRPSKNCRVEPLKSSGDIERIKQLLLSKRDKRNYCLFVLGINIGLRASDLTRLRVCDVYHLSHGRALDFGRIVEKKTGKIRNFHLNRSAKEAIELYLGERKPVLGEELLLPSRKHCRLDVRSVNHLVQGWCRELGIPGHYGSHTLRKTFGYHLFKQNIERDPGFIYTLQAILNHSSPETTLRYIDIDAEKIERVYQELNL